MIKRSNYIIRCYRLRRTKIRAANAITAEEAYIAKQQNKNSMKKWREKFSVAEDNII